VSHVYVIFGFVVIVAVLMLTKSIITTGRDLAQWAAVLTALAGLAAVLLLRVN
jgi:hypothetical protein